MTTRSDLVDANSFNRRRLVAALTSGSVDGSQIEPVRTLRTLVVGVVLALLLMAAAAGFRVLSPSLPEGWPSGHQDSGAGAQVTGPGR